MTLNMTTSLRRLTAWKRPQRVTRPTSRRKLPKEVQPVPLRQKPAGIYICPKCGFKPLAGKTLKQTNPVD